MLFTPILTASNPLVVSSQISLTFLFFLNFIRFSCFTFLKSPLVIMWDLGQSFLLHCWVGAHLYTVTLSRLCRKLGVSAWSPVPALNEYHGLSLPIVPLYLYPLPWVLCGPCGPQSESGAWCPWSFSSLLVSEGLLLCPHNACVQCAGVCFC